MKIKNRNDVEEKKYSKEECKKKHYLLYKVHSSKMSHDPTVQNSFVSSLFFVYLTQWFNITHFPNIRIMLHHQIDSSLFIVFKYKSTHK